MTTKLILDVDTGTDDAVALMFAALHPELELVGVTTVSGNVPVECSTENSLRVLDTIGRGDIGVHPGLTHPLARWNTPVRRHLLTDPTRNMHGTYLPLPAATSKASTIGAVEFLIETYRGASDEITLVAVAPLSNLGAALALEPRLRDLVPRLVIMGGGHAMGNETPAAEFNIWADPEAAHVVLTAGFRDVTLVPLDATCQALVSRADCDRLAALDTPAGRTAAELIRHRIDAYTAGHAVDVPDAAPVPDALCTALLVDPDVVRTRRLHVDVETEGRLTRGHTVMDTRPDGQPPNCTVALHADGRRFVELLHTAFSIER
ncbi:MAG: nucleoside hydrolase [Acidothermus sp.]|nr:nucleoside hydrolase [Acidothermus sp.]MCL6537203.1 nucleoside hydrolase [Acidothermus sp.]